MNEAELERLEAQAAQRKRRFAATLEEIQQQATLANLGEEAARLLGNVLPPASLIQAARRNPPVMLLLASCVAWLVRQMKTPARNTAKPHAKRRKISHKRLKETTHDR